MTADRTFAISLGLVLIPLGIWIWWKLSPKSGAVYTQLGKFGGLFIGAGVALVLIGLGFVHRH
jgi:hypothetical protein